VVKLSGGDTTELAVDGSFSVSGPLETFANAGGIHVARALLAEFSANMARQVGEQSAHFRPPPFRQSGPPRLPHHHRRRHHRRRRHAAEISGFGLLWRAFLSWLRGK
jgi:hypothetical protein